MCKLVLKVKVWDSCKLKLRAQPVQVLPKPKVWQSQTFTFGHTWQIGANLAKVCIEVCKKLCTELCSIMKPPIVLHWLVLVIFMSFWTVSWMTISILPLCGSLMFFSSPWSYCKESEICRYSMIALVQLMAHTSMHTCCLIITTTCHKNDISWLMME